MNVSMLLGSIDAQVRARLEPRREGLAFILTTGVLKVEVVLLLRWIEVVILGLLVSLASVVVHFRGNIAHSWLIAQWAPNNPKAAAAAISALSLLVGWLIALWKKRQVFTYSITEIVFGVFSSFQIALNLWPKGELSYFVGLGSALYVISRGGGNLWDALLAEAGNFHRATLKVGEP